MDVRNLVVERDSEQDFWHEFTQLVNAGVSVIQVRTHEIQRTLEILRKKTVLNNERYHEWNTKDLNRTFNVDNFEDIVIETEGQKFMMVTDLFEHIWSRYTSMAQGGTNFQEQTNEYYVLVGAQYYLENNPLVHEYVRQFSSYFPESCIKVVFVTEPSPVPEVYQPYIVPMDMQRPGHAELSDMTRKVFGDFGGQFEDFLEDEDLIARIAVAGAGMTLHEHETAVSRSAVDVCAVAEANGDEDGPDAINVEELAKGVSRQKTEIVKKNDLLEVILPESMANVGGMENLKEWVRKRTTNFSKAAREFGITPPKGVVFVGVPGTGKSLGAKAIAGEFEIPLIRLDFSKMFGSLVGQSEGQMRTALQMIEAMAPCVCFADEIDKGLGGIGQGGGDAGTSQRVLGAFLTWLQECTLPVFTVVTANNVAGLPPELLRRGRFDGIFSTTLPGKAERRDVLAIHLAKRGRDIDAFNESDIMEFIDATERYVPAEIEAAVKDGLVLAFDEGESPELEIRHLLEAVKAMVPLAVSHADAIARTVLWAKDNAIAASLTDEQRARGNRGKPSARKRIVRGTGPKPSNVSRLPTRTRRPDDGSEK